MRISKLALATVVIAVASAPTVSQTSAPPQLSFEVASIKPTAPGTHMQIRVEPGGRFVADGVPLGLLIAIAYRLQAYQMVGVEGWIMKAQWSIEAKAADAVDPPSASPPYMGVSDPMAQRLQSLLADRFALKTHHESREIQVYELTASPAGSKMTPVDAPPQSDPGASPGSRAKPRLTPDGKLAPDFVPPPGAVIAGPGIIAASAISMDQLVGLLNRVMNYPVIDKTGLKGYFNVRLQFDPESTPGAMGAPLPPAGGTNVAPLPSDDPPIFAAVQQQLGLKLQMAKDAVDVLVIDSASKPTEN